MKTAILAALIASPVLAAQPLSIEVRTRVDDIDARDLAERISDVASRTIPDASGEVEVKGDVLRIEQGYLVTLELRDEGKLGATASARASTPEELIDAAASASVDLFRAWKEASALSIPLDRPWAPKGAPLVGRRRSPFRQHWCARALG